MPSPSPASACSSLASQARSPFGKQHADASVAKSAGSMAVLSNLSSTAQTLSLSVPQSDDAELRVQVAARRTDRFGPTTQPTFSTSCVAAPSWPAKRKAYPVVMRVP
ncbi:hypothetical protein RJ55_02802 [Drechmeria coniospora]|nr:hypothetical protein RJ55_02802 [Drechmeria coniospora]